MKILYVSQYFPPEMGAPPARVHELARAWVRAGHEVTVLTGFPHHPTGVKRPGDHYRLTRRETLDGIDVIRSYVFATANKGQAKRMLSYASFMVSAAVIGPLRARRPDVVIATSPQLLCAVAGYIIARALRAPFVFEVRDLWPESVLAVDAMGDNAIIQGLRGVADFLYRHADLIVTVGPGYARKINELYGIGLDRFEIVPNGADLSRFIPGPRDNALRAEMGWGGKTVVLYAGTHGMAHALHRVLDVAALMAAGPGAPHFVFVGEGAEKENLVRAAAARVLTNVQFIGQQPKERIVEFYRACDIGLVTLRRTELFQEVLPSKIFEYLAMERPVVISVDGEARRVVEAAGAGIFVPPEEPEPMAAAIRRLAAGEGLRAAMGLSGRAYVMANYDREALAARYLEILGRVARG